MRSVSLLILICAIAFSPAVAQTNTYVTKRMSLEDCLATALKHNLDVQIKRYNPEISAYNLGSSYGAYEPTFTLNVSHDYAQNPNGIDAQGRSFSGTRTEDNSFSATISGVLPWGTVYDIGASLLDFTTFRAGSLPGTLPFNVTNTFYSPQALTNVSFVSTNYPTPSTSQELFSANRVGLLNLRQPLLKDFLIDSTRLAILINKKTLQSSELDVRFQVMSTVTAVEEAYYNLIYDEENIKVQQKAVELNSQQLAENRKRVEVGAMAPLDEKQAASQVAASQADLLAALGTEQTEQRVLRTLLSDNYGEWKDVAIEPTIPLVAVPEKFNVQDSWRRGLHDRPDLQQQKISLEKQGYIVKYQRNQVLPQLDLVGSAGYTVSSPSFSGYTRELGDFRDPYYSIGGVLSFPLTQKAARNNYNAAKATRAQIELTLKQLEQNVMVQIENDIAVANTSYQRVIATREARIYAEAALDAERKKLESGKSTSFVVLSLTSSLTTARSAEIRALADYNIALAQISLDEGSTLERHHVTVQWK